MEENKRNKDFENKNKNEGKIKSRFSSGAPTPSNRLPKPKCSLRQQARYKLTFIVTK
jgi:hypothetical protein